MNTLKNDAVARCFLYNYSDLLLNLTAKRQLEEYCSWQEQAWFRTPFGGKKCKIYSKDCFKISKQFPGNFFVPAGFYPYLAKKCEEANIEFINSSTLVPPSGIFTTINGLTYREQQEGAIKRAVAAGRGVIQMPTAGGKTVLSAGIFFSFFARYKNIKGLFLAHTVDLVNQAKEEFEQFLPGKVGIIQGSNISPNKITCGTIQSVSKLTIQQLQKISDMVIVDEVHKISGFGVKYFSILQDSLSPIRFGVTATPPTTKEGLLAMEGAIGPIIGKYTISDGVKAGYLSVPKINMMNYPNSHTTGKKTVYKDIYRHCVVNNPDRNTAVCKIVRYVLKRKETVLLFVKELAHGNNLAKMLDSLEISYSWIHGKSEKEERALVKKALEFKEAKVVICSTIWNEGISIKSLNNVINAAGGKDSKRTIQIVGRGTRVDEGKTTVTIWDFADKQKYLSDHADDRVSTYKSQGWEVEYYE